MVEGEDGSEGTLGGVSHDLCCAGMALLYECSGDGFPRCRLLRSCLRRLALGPRVLVLVSLPGVTGGGVG